MSQFIIWQKPPRYVIIGVHKENYSSTETAYDAFEAGRLARQFTNQYFDTGECQYERVFIIDRQEHKTIADIPCYHIKYREPGLRPWHTNGTKE